MQALSVKKNEPVVIHKKQSLNIGDLLKKTRLEKGYRLPHIVKLLNIKEEYLKALEEENSKGFPKGSIYIIGFLRAYAQLLGLNAEEIVPLFKKKHNIEIMHYIPTTFPTEDTKEEESIETVSQKPLSFSTKWSLISLGAFIGIFYMKDFVSWQPILDKIETYFFSIL